MTIQKLQEKYKEISKLIPAVETASNIEKIIGFYTSKIEQEGNWKKLKEWIEYLAQKDTIQAVLAINKLRKTTQERKEELISILLSSIEEQTDIEEKFYNLMITLLYLNKFDEASNLYKSLKENSYKFKEDELEKEEIDRISFNNRITTNLLSSSNYNLILNYIHIIQKAKDFDSIRYSLQKFKLAPKEKNREIIIEIVNEFFKNKRMNDVLYFLNQIGVTRYLDYLPKDKSASEYLEIIDKKCGLFAKLHVQKKIFFEDNYEKYGDTILCLKEWIKYIENSEDNEVYKILKQIDAITDILLEDIKVLENDKEIIKKIEEFSVFTIQMKGMSIVKTINLINRILTLETSIHQKVEYIKKIKGINAFTYIDGQFDSNMTKIRSSYYSLTIENRIMFKKLLDSITIEEVEDYIYIYMNTNIKYIVYIEEFVKKLLETGSTKVFELFSSYQFYGTITKTENNKFYSLKLLSAYNQRTIILRKDVIEGNGDNIIYESYIKGYDKLVNQLIFENIRPYKEEQHIKTKDNTENILEIIKIQIEFLDELNKKSTIQIINDENNPYKYINDLDIISEEKHIKRMRIITDIKKNKEIIKSIKEQYYERVKNRYYELLNDEKVSVKKIIKYYMNTVTKYILPFEELCQIISNTEKHKKKKQIYLNEYLREQIIFEDVDEENNIVGLLQFECNKIKYKGISIKKDFSNKLCYYTGTIIKYDVQEKEVIVSGLYYSKLGRNSNEYIKVIEILEKFIETQDMKILKKLENMPTMTELLNENNIQYSWDNFLLQSYKELYYECITILIYDLDKLKTFLEYLGENNYWIRQEEGTIYSKQWCINNNFIVEKEKENFLQKAKEEDIETIIFCYNHTYFKNIIPIDQLLRNIFRFNPKRRSIIKENGCVDLQPYKIEIVMTISKNNENSEYSILKNSSVKEGIKAKIIQYNNAMLKQKQYLEVLEYDTVNNAILVKPIVEKMVKDKYLHRTLQYIYIASKLLDKKYSIKEIYMFLIDERTETLNKYGKAKMNTQYVKRDLEKLPAPFQKNTIKKFKKYILDKIETKEINEETLKYVFTIYDKTIIRYLIPLDEFLNMLQTNNIKCDYNFEVEIVYKKDILENKHLAYFLRYILTKKIKIINSNQIQLEAQKNYKALIKSYNNSEDTITLEIIEEVNYQEKEKVLN